MISWIWIWRKWNFHVVVLWLGPASDAPLIIAYAKQNSKANVSIKFKETIIGVKNAPAVPAYSGHGSRTNKAFDPGLIYDATGQDYVNLLCSLNNCRHPILKCSTTSPCYNFSTPSSHLNYPSFISLYIWWRYKINQ